MQNETPTSILVMSFSDISVDARVLKQIRLFHEQGYEVLTCGFGPKPAESSRHVELDPAEARWLVLLRAAFVRLHCYKLAYWSTPFVRAAKRTLRKLSPNAVFANDLDTAGLARALARPERIHVDLHEYWPGRDDQNLAWVKLRQPFMKWQLVKYVSGVASATTVSDTIARRYFEEFKIPMGTVTNASPFKDYAPTPVGETIRLVHSGASRPNRRTELLIEAVGACSAPVTLDLYLTDPGTPYHDKLTRLAAQFDGRVRVLPPVPQDQLVATLSAYDIGIHVLPPTNSNNALALPNKFFDYVQARLGLVIGPTASMQELLEFNALGVVTDDFTAGSLTMTLNRLTKEEVEQFKTNSDLAARSLSAEVQNVGWSNAVQQIVASA